MVSLLLIVSAALVVAFSFEEHSVQPLARYFVEKATGRTLTIDGGLELRAGRVVVVELRGARLANAEWGSSEDMLSVDRAELSVDLRQLLRGKAVAQLLHVDGAKLLFEQDQQGRSNWAFGDEAGEQPVSGERETEAEAKDSANVTPPLVARSRLTDIDITVIHAAMQQPLTINLDSLNHNVDRKSRLHTSLVGTIEGRSMKLQASAGPLAQVLNAGEIDFDLNADFENLKVEAGGNLDQWLQPQRANVEISATSPEIARVFETLKLAPLISGATDVKASLQPGDGDHRLEISADVGALVFKTRAQLPTLYSIDGTTLMASANGPDLSAAARLAGVDGLPAQPFDFETSATLAGENLTIGETRFETGTTRLLASGEMTRFPQIEGSNMQLRLEGGNYLDYAELMGVTEISKLKPGPFQLDANLEYDSSNEQLFSANLSLAGSSGDFSGSLTDYPDFTGSRLDFRLSGESDELLRQVLGHPARIPGAYTFEGALERSAQGIVIDNAALEIGENRLEASGTIGEDPLREHSEFSIRYQGPDLDKIAANLGYEGFLPTGETEISAVARIRQSGLDVEEFKARIGRNRLAAAGLVSLQDAIGDSKLEIALSGEDIAEIVPPAYHAWVEAGQTFELNGKLASATGKLVIDDMAARLGEVKLSASGSVSIPQPLAGTMLTLETTGPDLAAIVPANLLPFALPAQEFSLSGDLGLSDEGLKLDGVNAMIGADSFSVSGNVPLDTPTDGLELAVSASGPDLGNLLSLQDQQIDISEMSYDIASNLRMSEGILEMKDFGFKTPRGRFSGQVSISVLNPLQFGSFDLKAEGDNLQEFLPPIPGYIPAAVSFDLEAKGEWDDLAVHIEQGLLLLDATRVEAQGEISLPPNLSTTGMKLAATGDSLADLGQFGDLSLPQEAFDIEASLEADSKGITIPRLDARAGDSDLRGSVQLEMVEKPQITVNLVSDRINLAKLMSFEEEAEEDNPEEPQVDDGRLIPDEPVFAEKLNMVNLDASLRLAELHMPRTTLRDIVFDGVLVDGDLRVEKLTASATGGQVVARFQATADGDRIVTNGKLEGTDFVLTRVDADSESVFPEQDLRLEFETSGATTRELAANLNAYALLTGESGRLENSFALGLYGEFFRELLRSVNPFVTREPYTNIECFTAYAEIEDGVARIDPGTVLQTDKLNMYTRGSVDLETEAIALRFDTAARQGLGIGAADFINPFVGVSGTMSSPKLGIDPKSATFQGGFAVATGGLTIVAKSLYSRWFGEKNPCLQLEQDADDYLQARQAERDKRIAEEQKSATDDEPGDQSKAE